MKIERRFLIARSLARLIQRECRGTDRVVEACFTPQPNRTQLVRITPNEAQLILNTRTGDEWESEAAAVPLSHAAALVDVASGHLAYDRATVPVRDGRSGFLDRIFEPGPLDLVVVAFATREKGSEFEPPAWFGQEVTQDTAFTNIAMALSWPLRAHEEVSNDMLEALLLDLDELRPALEAGQSGAYAGPTSSQLPSGREKPTENRADDVIRNLAAVARLAPTARQLSSRLGRDA